jgi:hypothetical protein
MVGGCGGLCLVVGAMLWWSHWSEWRAQVEVWWEEGRGHVLNICAIGQGLTFMPLHPITPYPPTAVRRAALASAYSPIVQSRASSSNHSSAVALSARAAGGSVVDKFRARDEAQGWTGGVLSLRRNRLWGLFVGSGIMIVNVRYQGSEYGAFRPEHHQVKIEEHIVITY